MRSFNDFTFIAVALQEYWLVLSICFLPPCITDITAYVKCRNTCLSLHCFKIIFIITDIISTIIIIVVIVILYLYFYSTAPLSNDKASAVVHSICAFLLSILVSWRRLGLCFPCYKVTGQPVHQSVCCTKCRILDLQSHKRYQVDYRNIDHNCFAEVECYFVWLSTVTKTLT